ncbi:UNVERIFIED_CONTAM: LysR family transcriptional regulator, partial [Lactiplantibacillus plantarum]
LSAKIVWRRVVDKLLSAAHVQPKVGYEVEEGHTMAVFVRYSMGVALMPYLPLLNHGRVQIKHLADQPLQHQIYLVVRLSGFITPAVHRFQEFIRSYCWQHYTNQERSI